MDREKLRRFAGKNAVLIPLLLVGVTLLIIPGKRTTEEARSETGTPEELRLAAALSRVEGVGEACVLLAEKPGRDAGYMGAVVVCPGASQPEVRLRIVETVSAFTGLGSHQIVVQKMIS